MLNTSALEMQVNCSIAHVRVRVHVYVCAGGMAKNILSSHETKVNEKQTSDMTG